MMDAIPLTVFDKQRESPITTAPVVVKCKFHRSSKRITFASSALSFGLLRSKIDQTFSLSQSAYSIRYKDDENEVTDISCDSDLLEAIDYFSEGTDDSCATTSVASFSSEGTPKIIIPLFIELDYDGPSLSETMSLRSAHYMESMRLGSQASLPYNKSDADSFIESTRFSRRHIEVQGPPPLMLNASVICGIISAIQAPILFSLLDWDQFSSNVGMRFIHTLFTWSIIFNLFGAVIAIVSKRSTAHRQAVNRYAASANLESGLPHHAVLTNAGNNGTRRFREVIHFISQRAGQVAERSARIFTVCGIICLLCAAMSLMWVSHPLTLHTVSMRSLLMVVTWFFLACLSYFVFEPANS